MSELFYTTLNLKVVVDVVEDKNRVLCVRIRANDLLVANFDINILWDFLKQELAKRQDHTSPGLRRRIYEAQNVQRLTEEFLLQERKREQK